MRNIVVGIIICLVTQVTSGQFVLAQQSAITACSACDNDELLIKINKFRGFQNEFNSGNHDIGAVHRFADAYAKLLFTIDKATRQQSEMAIPCLKLLGLSLNDEWINLDIDNIVKISKRFDNNDERFKQIKYLISEIIHLRWADFLRGKVYWFPANLLIAPATLLC